MYKKPFHLVLFLLFTSFFNSFSADATIGITVNLDAEIKATPSAGGTTISVMANKGEVTTVGMPWSGSSQKVDYDFQIIPINPRYYDTTFTKNIDQWWNDPIEVDLVVKPLPTDTAFIPIRSNVGLKLIATPLEMIKGGVPQEKFEINLPAKTQDTLMLPVETNLITPINQIFHLSSNKTFIKEFNNRIELSLPFSYLNGSIDVISMAGRKIATFNLTSTTKNSLSIWNVSTGMYVLNIKSKNGVLSNHKIHHKGGQLLVNTNFDHNLSTKYSSKTKANRNSSDLRGTIAKYRFELQSSDQNYNDTTFEIELTGQMNGSRYFYLINPNDTGSKFDQILDSLTYETLFPFRYGLGRGKYPDGEFPPEDEIVYDEGDGFFDFYTYGSLTKALEEMSKIEVDLYQLEGHDYMHRIAWRNKKTGESRSMVNNIAYDDYKTSDNEYLAHQIDYADFCNEGDLETRRIELAAFLANISHETTGQGTKEETKRWGLYWREEVAWQKGSNALDYIDPNHDTYPPVSGISYHGRGAIQLSWNYNYGQLSQFLYGDKDILLANPDKLIPDNGIATDAFMAAIWFWMTPQAPKPSCHDVMVGNWTPSSEDIAAGRDKSKFGATINIINGREECNKGDGLVSEVKDRIGFYEKYSRDMNVPKEDYCDCGQMTPW